MLVIYSVCKIVDDPLPHWIFIRIDCLMKYYFGSSRLERNRHGMATILLYLTLCH